MGKIRETASCERERIIELYKQGKSQRQIAEMTGKPRTTVQSIIKKYISTGSCVNQPRQGRPRKIDQRGERKLVRIVKHNPHISGTKLKAEFQQSSGTIVSVDTIRRVLYRVGLQARVSRKKPWVNKINRRKRLAFAQEYVTKSEHFWSRVIFTDECKICMLDTSGKPLVWRKPKSAYNKENLTPTVKYGGGSIMVWGCMSAAGVGKFQIIDGIMDRWIYLDILKTQLRASAEKLRMGNDWMFQQDNDPKHTAWVVKQLLLYNTPHVLKTPPQSPDITPIEHLCAHIKRKLHKTPISNKHMLRQRFSEEWNNISPQVTGKLVESMQRRLQTIIRSK